MNRSFSYVSLVALSVASLCVQQTPLVAQESEGVNGLFSQFDANQDAQISREEVFPTNHPLASFKDLQLKADQFFTAADTDQDGALTAMELEQAPATSSFFRWLGLAGSELLHKFQQSDSDSSGKISREELLASAEPDQHHETNRWLTILDFDADGELSFSEYVLLPQHTPREFYFGVPDPIQEAGVAEIVSARERFSRSDRDGDQQLNSTEWQEFSTGHFLAAMFDQIDLNKDQQITLAELETGLNVAFGITDAQGTLLGHTNGHIFSWRRFIEEIDFDRDRKISRSEVSDRFPQSLSVEEQDALFMSLDLNQDQHLDSTEWALAGNSRVPTSWVDLFDKFSETDVNLDGLLSLQELRERVPPWEQKYIASIFPAYDTNDDGLISFMEYRGMPLGTFSLLWMDQRDANGDGSLSLEEFNTRPGLPFLGVSNFFLIKLDRNQDGKLTLNEFHFSVDLNQVPSASLIALFDENQDGVVSQDELFQSADTPSALQAIRPFYEPVWRATGVTTDAPISESQLESAPALRKILIGLFELKQTQAVTFTQADADQDGLLSLAEWEASLQHPCGPEQLRNWQTVDFNGDGMLSFHEYLAMPDHVLLELRVGVLDPIADAADEEVAHARELFLIADADRNGQLTHLEWSRLSEGKFYAAYRQQFDSNDDQLVSLLELERGILFAYGVSDLAGTPLRKLNGEIFNWRGNIEEIDWNRDHLNSREENALRPYPPRTPEEIEAHFVELDVDQNGLLSIAELANVGNEKILNSWKDQIAKFIETDADQDGFLSPADLQQTVAPWEQKYNDSLFPAYDRDGDGKLSFVEFRASPLGNHTLIWMNQEDQDRDGYLSLQEFHPREGLAFLGVSKVFFEQLDRNQDGKLALSEYQFPVDFMTAPIAVVLEVCDTDGNKKISMEELLNRGTARSVLDGVIEKYGVLFAQCDLNGDGELDEQELESTEQARTLVLHLEQLSRKIAPDFSQMDSNQDGRLSRDEWQAGHGGTFDETAQQDWNIFDFDNDGSLSFAEYIAQPHVSPLLARGTVADPVAEVGREFIRTALASFIAADADHDNELTEEEWRTFANKEFFRDYRSQFDMDGNNKISQGELSRGLEVAFGLNDFSGTPLRKLNGEVFNWRGNIEEIDLDRNLENSYSEHAKRPYPPQTDEQLRELFAKLDRDGNQRLTVQELATAGNQTLLNSWQDQVWKFKDFDVNHDGFLVVDELRTSVPPWEAKYIDSLIPAYDTNQDGKISFVEFRASPLSNLTLIWMDQEDSDGDGFITLKEFHPRPGLPYLGVSKIFFDKLDRNRDGFLDTSEYRFPLNLSKIPTNMAFNIFDTNRDSVIDSTEYVQESLKSLPLNLSDYDRQSAVMKLEEAFRYADRNRDGQLEYEEFQNSQQALGMTAPTERQVDPAVMAKYAPNKAQQAADPNFKWYVLGGINLLLWLLVGWWLLQPKKQLKLSEEHQAEQTGASP